MSRSARRQRAQRIATALSIVIAVAALTLIVVYARTIDWPAVFAAVTETPPGRIAAALALTALGYLVYSSFDLLARRYLGYPLAPLSTMPVAMTSFALNLNVGSMAGGIGGRYALYTRMGLGTRTIVKIIAFAVATNWMGYAALAGVVLLAAPAVLHDAWPLSATLLNLTGGLLLAVTLSYLALCAVLGRRQASFGRVTLRVPDTVTALLQIAFGCLHWLVMALVIWLLLPDDIGYLSAVSVLLASMVAGLVARIPGGLGVIEFVFSVLLGQGERTAEILAAVLTFRAVYYFVPLMLAVSVGVPWIASHGRATRARQASA